jgi:hypothetical protein
VPCNGVSCCLQLSVIDGDAFNETAPDPLATIMELHTSDEVRQALQHNLLDSCMMAQAAANIECNGGSC